MEQQFIAEQWRTLNINVNIILEYVKETKEQNIALKKELREVKEALKKIKK